jgi:SAM-dependent methyltransferase
MQKLGAKKVDSFDISSEAIKRCKKINPNAYVNNILSLKPDPVYDFVMSMGVLHHNRNTREAFSKVASQVKKGGMLHIMVYDKKYDHEYDGYRGDTSIEKHKEWEKLSFEEKIKMCEKKTKTVGGDIHGWFDAFNPEFNWSFSPEEVKGWFKEEGFDKMKLIVKSHFNSIPTSQVNMNGVKS